MGVKQNILLAIVVVLLHTSSQAQTDEAMIRQSIETFFEGFGKGDTSLMSGVMMPDMTLKTVVDRKDGMVKVNAESRKEFLKIMAEPRKQKLTETIVSWDIRVDGGYASAWCTYKFYLDTTFRHWGTDDFQLVKTGGKWKILSITDTRRKKEPGKTAVHELQTEEALRKEIDVLMNNWHKAAATADEKIFFGSMGDHAIYLGTDKTENWTKKDFEAWSKKYFDQDRAWDFTPHDRHIYFSNDREYAWFDELLETWMGVCRGSGVLHWENGEWKILHYNLAVTIANEKIQEFVKINK